MFGTYRTREKLMLGRDAHQRNLLRAFVAHILQSIKPDKGYDEISGHWPHYLAVHVGLDNDLTYIIEPQHDISNNVVCATSKA